MTSPKCKSRCGNRFKQKSKSAGFTLIELMIVVAIVGILASSAISSYQDYVLRSKLTETATKLSSFARAFEIYKQIHGEFPNDSHIDLPTASGLTINEDLWSQTTLLGGNWNWEGPDRYSYAGISIAGITAEEHEITQFDIVIDNGDLQSGKFRKTGNGRYTYIIDE